MSKSRAIRLATELATRQRDGLAQRHAQAIRNLDFAKSQLAQLEGYSRDTDGRWVAGGSAVALSTELIRHHYQFMDRLQQAVQMQLGVISRMEAAVATARKALLQAEYRVTGLNQVQKARETEVRMESQRRQQRTSDDFAGLMHIRRNRSEETYEY